VTREDISKLSKEDKWKIWFHYLLVQLSLKHSFHVRDVINDPEDYGWGDYDKKFGNIEIRYLWKTLRYVKFENYTDDMLYEWYWRFKNEIEL
jgi:hypothetical protein